MARRGPNHYRADNIKQGYHTIDITL
jgi:hypothetical protein